MKLHVVSPRYGPEISGGAETAARALATRLATRPGWSVEVLTTTARDEATWTDALPSGTTTIDGVTVRRFPVTAPRAPDFDRATRRITHAPKKPSLEQQHAWVEAQGPVAPELLDAIKQSDADVVTFQPYLYAPTVFGVPIAGARSVLHPAAHDERVIRLPVYRDVLRGAAGIVYWSDAERRFTERTFPVGAQHQIVLGLGVDEGTGDEASARAAVGLGDRPYLLCLGRVDDGKGAGVLAACFAAYKERHPSALALVFAGPVSDAPAPHADVLVTGRIGEAVKWGLLRGATALVSPSAYESFGIVLLEAWAVGTPALVNGRAAVSRDHAEHSNGALVFSTYPEFEVALESLLASPALQEALGANGRTYVTSHYQWPDLLDRYAAFLESVAVRAR